MSNLIAQWAQWLKDGFGIYDIAIKSGFNRDVVKARLVEWGLWS